MFFQETSLYKLAYINSVSFNYKKLLSVEPLKNKTFKTTNN